MVACVVDSFGGGVEGCIRLSSLLSVPKVDGFSKICGGGGRGCVGDRGCDGSPSNLRD